MTQPLRLMSSSSFEKASPAPGAAPRGAGQRLALAVCPSQLTFKDSTAGGNFSLPLSHSLINFDLVWLSMSVLTHLSPLSLKASWLFKKQFSLLDART